MRACCVACGPAYRAAHGSPSDPKLHRVAYGRAGAPMRGLRHRHACAAHASRRRSRSRWSSTSPSTASCTALVCVCACTCVGVRACACECVRTCVRCTHMPKVDVFALRRPERSDQPAGTAHHWKPLQTLQRTATNKQLHTHKTTQKSAAQPPPHARCSRAARQPRNAAWDTAKHARAHVLLSSTLLPYADCGPHSLTARASLSPSACHRCPASPAATLHSSHPRPLPPIAFPLPSLSSP